MKDLPAAIDTLLTRHSVGGKHLIDPGPTEEELRLMVRCALRAPDHCALAPWRWVMVCGEARGRLASLFEAAALDGGKSLEEARMDAERGARAPVSAGLVARIRDDVGEVPAHEQWIAVGAALGNFVNAAHALGFGAKMVSGRKARHPRVVEAFCEPGEILVGWVCLGSVADSSRKPESKEREAPVRFW